MLPIKEWIMWAFLVLTATGVIYAKGHADATKSLQIEHQQELITFNQQREKEREATQRTLADISTKWQGHLAEAQSAADRTLADLRSDNVRLRVKLADATVSSIVGSGGPIADGQAELHPDTARFLVGQAQRCDAQVEALQETVRALQGAAHE